MALDTHINGNGRIQFHTTPLYIQVREDIHMRIVSGEWAAALPNEGDIARMFGVSAGTARKALDALEADGVVTRRQGRGTFACRGYSPKAARLIHPERPPHVSEAVFYRELAEGAAEIAGKLELQLRRALVAKREVV